MVGPYVNMVVEGELDQKVVEKVFAKFGIYPARIYGKQGKEYIMRKLKGFYRAAITTGSPWVVVCDLDDAICAPDFLRDYSPGTSDNFLFRLAVRELEAWLLADKAKMAKFLGIPEKKIPEQVESLPKPKRTIIDLARQSRKKDIREDIPPQPGTTAKQGVLYNSRMEEFVDEHWRMEVAEIFSDSLRRFIRRLSHLANKQSSR
jgi:hypothetical protein